MIDWTRYEFREIPFLAVPAIDIRSRDKRANGRLFYKEPFNNLFENMKKRVLSEQFPWFYLGSSSTVFGNGKSAFLAALFWDLVELKKNVIWAAATSTPRMRDLLARIIDALVSQGKIADLNLRLSPLSIDKIAQILSEKDLHLSPSTIYALYQLISASQHTITFVYSNIKRSIPVQEHTDLFAALLNLLYASGEPRLIILIDQFEEYVRSHATSAQRQNLGYELNDLLRSTGESTTIVVTTHPEAESILFSQPEADTFATIETSSVSLPSWNEQNLIGMARYCMETYRTPAYSKDPLYPFEEGVMKYFVHRTSLNPRSLILALRAALLLGSFEDYVVVDEGFLNRHHREIFGGYENKWHDFKEGKFKYSV